jgi:hypothetical protein
VATLNFFFLVSSWKTNILSSFEHGDLTIKTLTFCQAIFRFLDLKSLTHSFSVSDSIVFLGDGTKPAGSSREDYHFFGRGLENGQ